MKPIVQQPEEDHLTTLKKEARTHHSLPLTLLTIHQLDSTYYGQINKSYQKQGIGILITLPFQAYFGFWRNNRPEGLGLVLNPTGEVIYGNFNRSALVGAGVVDDGQFLRVGVFDGLDLVGVGFEYTFPTSKWRMLKYVRGVPVEQLRQELKPLAEGLPDMLFAQHSLHQLLTNYLQARFFLSNPSPNQNLKKAKAPEETDKYQGLNEILISKKEDLLALGFRDEGGLHGLGVIFNQKERALVQAGYYMGGTLEGYCFEQVEGSGSQIGPFFQGKKYKDAGVKHGAFMRYANPRAQGVGVEYRQGVEIGETTITEEQLLKRQKAYNFQQKDFLSAKNTVDFNQLFDLFTPPQARHRNSSPKEPSYDLIDPSSIKTSKSTKGLGKQSHRGTVLKNRYSNSFLPESEREGQRSCVDMVRQKMRGYDVVKNEKSLRGNSEDECKRILDSNLRLQEEAEESIALEENPFDSALIGNNLLHQSPKRRH